MNQVDKAITRAAELDLTRLALIPQSRRENTEFYFKGQGFSPDEIIWLEQPITELNPSISFPCELKELYLNYNKISYLPSSMANMQRLVLLHLGYNQLTEIPDVVFSLPTLERLYLQKNNLTCTPSALAKLNQLRLKVLKL